MVDGCSDGELRNSVGNDLLVISSDGWNGGISIWRESGDTLDKPLHGPFVAKLLNDLFGIHVVVEHHSLAFKFAIQKHCVSAGAAFSNSKCIFEATLIWSSQTG
ncbi:uncharacterized protein LOC132299706 isoform X1 [Cornus florida]|uniref:uncharacterized protein LOC132299706 isoform X1 n=2 Tax=Cornus florida TaxID=4283 RepID=UPI0028A26E7E|nr:uncharacterized protein LOC132299706 isoform X1 [Cornus florida]